MAAAAAAELVTRNASAALAGTEAITGVAPKEYVVYSLRIRALAEFVGMAMVIYTGEAALANELLPSTKGHGMGWGWTVFSFGFAFFPPLQAFQLISAKLNPAMALAQAIWGNITWVDFVVLSLAEVAGAFVGACLHWLHYYPHWRTVPEPPALAGEERLLRCRDVAADDALRISGYTTRADRVNRPTNPLADLRYRLRGLHHPHAEEEATADDVLEGYFMHRDAPARVASKVMGGGGGGAALARRSIQVADLERFLEEKHVEQTLRHRTCPSCAANGDDADAGNTDADNGGGNASDSAHPRKGHAGAAHGAVAVAVRPLRRAASGVPKRVADEEATRARALYCAAVRADQNLKLSIFATRPAINAPLFNLLTEAMGTTALILVALLIELQARRLPVDLRPLYVVGLQPLLICFAIVMLISGLGGPTAYAANPARDLGPRLAHWALPIPNKGPSEWYYAWVPVIGPLLGGAVAGALYIALEEMTFPGGGPKG